MKNYWNYMKTYKKYIITIILGALLVSCDEKNFDYLYDYGEKVTIHFGGVYGSEKEGYRISGCILGKHEDSPTYIKLIARNAEEEILITKLVQVYDATVKSKCANSKEEWVSVKIDTRKKEIITSSPADKDLDLTTQKENLYWIIGKSLSFLIIFSIIYVFFGGLYITIFFYNRVKKWIHPDIPNYYECYGEPFSKEEKKLIDDLVDCGYNRESVCRILRNEKRSLGLSEDKPKN